MFASVEHMRGLVGPIGGNLERSNPRVRLAAKLAGSAPLPS
jgi:hypothetical protein